MLSKAPALKIYIIAGEASGDILGGKLILALKKLYQGNIEFFGIGGSQMQEAGLNSLFPMEELSLMGFVEILPHIPHMLKRIKQTVDHITEVNPNIVITIDSPGFNCRVAKKLDKNKIPLVHYVAPTVWAYKPKRAQKFARLFSHLLTILPFEPPYFTKEGLPTTFVGHPILENEEEQNNNKTDKENFRKKYNISSDAFILLAMPGSRKTEISRLLDVYIEAFKELNKKIPNLYIVIPVAEYLREFVTTKTNNLGLNIIVITNPDEKKQLFATANFGLIKSGTSTLEVAMARIAMIVTYKVSFISYLIIKSLVKVKFATLINLIADKEIIPEFLQQNCTAENITNAILDLVNNKEKADLQLKLTAEALDKLKPALGNSPSENAAKMVLGLVG